MTMLDMRPRTDSAPPSLRRDPPLQLPPGNTFVRYIATLALAQIERSSPQEIATRMWPSDLVLRAATAPAMTSTAGWAAELVQRLVADGLRALGPASAGALLLQQGLVLSFEGHGVISAPGLVAEYGNAGFVAEGQPIPVRQLADTAAQLLPHKLAAIAVLTREMIDSSNAEALIGDALMRAAGRMLDEVLFDANPESAARPAGLRNGVAALTASTNTDAIQARVRRRRRPDQFARAGRRQWAVCAGRFARARFVDASALCTCGQLGQSLWLKCRDQRSARDRARRAGGGIEPRA